MKLNSNDHVTMPAARRPRRAGARRWNESRAWMAVCITVTTYVLRVLTEQGPWHGDSGRAVRAPNNSVLNAEVRTVRLSNRGRASGPAAASVPAPSAKCIPPGAAQ